MNEAKAIQRPEELQKILLKDRGDEIIEAVFSAELNNIIKSRGEPDAIIRYMVDMIRYVLKLDGASKSMLIADVVSAWGIAYPTCLSDIVSSVANYMIESFDGELFIEGAMIGLFEALNLTRNSQAEKDLLSLFRDGTILSAMDAAKPTKEGKGRLNNALGLYTALSWSDGQFSHDRRGMTALGVKMLESKLGKINPHMVKDLILSLKLREENFLAYFSWQLAHLLAVNGPTNVMFSCKFGAEIEMQVWEKKFPELVRDLPRLAAPAA